MSKADENVKKAKKVLEEISGDEREIYLAELREKYIMDQIDIEEAGFDKGLKAGIERGVKQGILQTAKKMKHDGVDIDTIIKYTNLTKETIENL